MAKKKKVKDISNQTLAALLAIAIIISLLGTLFVVQRTQKITYISGAAIEQDTATLTATIETTTAINFTYETLNWSTGQIASGNANCTLATNDTSLDSGCKNFSVISRPLQIDNLGNQNVSLNLSTGKTGITLFGGSANLDSYMWAMGENETGVCLTAGGSGNGFENTTWSSVSTDPITACPWFNAGDTKDSIHLDIKLVIPSDASTGTLSDTITAVAETI